MAIALVDSGSGNGGTGDSTIDVSGIDVTGSNTFLIAVIVQASNTSNPEAAGCAVTWDFGGVAEDVPHIGSVANPSRGMSVYALKALTGGSGKTVRFSGLSATNKQCLVITLSGVDQTTPNGTVDLVEQPGAGTSQATSSITSDAGDWIFSFASNGDQTPNYSIAGGNFTIQLTLTANNGVLSWADDRVGGTATATWSFDSASNVGLISFNVNAASGGAFTLTAESGTFTITGTAASLEYGRRLDAASGSVALTGTAASLEYGRALSAASGTVVITGTDATLTYSAAGNKVLTAESGAFAITGTAASLEAGRKVSAESGSVVITGTAASLERGYPLVASPGSVVITGTAADLRSTRTLQALSGSYAITGTAAVLTWSGESATISRVSLRGSYAPMIPLSGSYEPTVTGLTGSVS